VDPQEPPLTVVVDTNVIAYLVLRTEPFYAEVVDFWVSDHEPIAPASWEAELANTLWVTVRAGVCDRDTALAHLAFAARLNVASVPVQELWGDSLRTACESNHPAYDTLFVELARRRGAPLVTFDKRVLERFPDVARRPNAL